MIQWFLQTIIFRDLSKPRIRQLCLLKKLSRCKWASSMRVILYAKSAWLFNVRLFYLWVVCWQKLLSQLYFVSMEMQIFSQNLLKSSFNVQSCSRWRMEVFGLSVTPSQAAVMFVRERPQHSHVVCLTSTIQPVPSNFQIWWVLERFLHRKLDTLHET